MPVWSISLRPPTCHAAGEARRPPEPAGEGIGVSRLQKFAVAGLERTGADQAHLAPEHVDQLGQLVQLHPPQQPPQGRDAGVIADLEQHTAGRLVEGLHLAEPLLRVHRHRPEFQEPEGTPAPAQADLAEEEGAGRSQSNQQRDRHHHGKEHHQADPRHEDVDDPLGLRPSSPHARKARPPGRRRGRDVMPPVVEVAGVTSTVVQPTSDGSGRRVNPQGHQGASPISWPGNEHQRSSSKSVRPWHHRLRYDCPALK